jgi:hypothetical protein
MNATSNGPRFIEPRAEPITSARWKRRAPKDQQKPASTGHLTGQRLAHAASAGKPPPALHQLDISYRDSSLAFDDGSVTSSLQAGDRAPDARLSDGSRLFERFATANSSSSPSNLASG